VRCPRGTDFFVPGQGDPVFSINFPSAQTAQPGNLGVAISGSISLQFSLYDIPSQIKYINLDGDDLDSAKRDDTDGDDDDGLPSPAGSSFAVM